MPIYEYRCTECGHELEKLQKLSDAPLVDCPVCNKPGLRKLVSAASFRLKGSGWYETDFKKGNQKNVVKDDSATPAKAAGGDKAASGDGKAAGDKPAGGGKQVASEKKASGDKQAGGGERSR